MSTIEEIFKKHGLTIQEVFERSQRCEDFSQDVIEDCRLFALANKFEPEHIVRCHAQRIITDFGFVMVSYIILGYKTFSEIKDEVLAGRFKPHKAILGRHLPWCGVQSKNSAV